MGRHGHRRHVVKGACDKKGATFTTYDAAMAAVARTKDAIRAYRGTCCGYYHITRYTEDEYAQRVAEYAPTRCTEHEFCDTVDPETKRTQEDSDEDREARHREQGVHARDAGSASLVRDESSRPSPSPAEVARRLQARRDQGFA